MIAVMDLIRAYPNENTAFIGFFMTDVSVQNTGIGSTIIDELCSYLTEIGFERVRLGWAERQSTVKVFLAQEWIYRNRDYI